MDNEKYIDEMDDKIKVEYGEVSEKILQIIKKSNQDNFKDRKD